MEQSLVRRCIDKDFESILSVINDGAKAYVGHIPSDCTHDPYMSGDDLVKEIASGVEFWACSSSEELIAVMGMQSVQDVVLIRHAYVRGKS